MRNRAALAAAVLAVAAAPAVGQEAVRVSSLTHVAAAACLQTDVSDACVAGFRQAATAGAPAKARLLLKVTATCTYQDDSPDLGLEDVTVQVGEPVGVFRDRWRPCGALDWVPAGSSYQVTYTRTRVLRERVGPKRLQRYPVQVAWRLGSALDGMTIIDRSDHRAARYRRVWDSSFDRYVNVCLNGSRRLWASGGRLYCRVQERAGSARVAFLLR